jgi:hypothetical protein
MRLVVFTLVVILSGYVTGSDLRKNHFDFKYSGEVKGNYFALAHCVVETMESHEKWMISSLEYDLRVFILT